MQIILDNFLRPQSAVEKIDGDEGDHQDGVERMLQPGDDDCVIGMGEIKNAVDEPDAERNGEDGREAQKFPMFDGVHAHVFPMAHNQVQAVASAVSSKTT